MSDVIINISGPVLEIILNRPDKKNALTQAMYQTMSDAIESAQQEDNVRVVIIKGQGNCFTAGNDLHDFVATGNSDDQQLKNPFMQSLIECQLPIVAQVQGLAIGIGTTMLLHCDLVVCADNARFTMPFVDLGLVPEFASSYLLPKLAGHRKASKWLLLGESFGPEEAEECGLVTDIVALDQLQEATDAMVKKLVLKPKMSLVESKKLMKSDQGEILLHMFKELDIFVRQLNSPAAKEAFNAFLEKRTPDRAIYH